MSPPTAAQCSLDEAKRRGKQGELRKSNWLALVALASGVLLASCGAADGSPTGSGGTSSGGEHQSGRAGSGGEHQSGGAENSSHSGGRTTTGQAGAGAGGAGGWPAVDPACHCVFDDLGFECSLAIELFAQRLPVPSSCAHDLDYVERSDCADGTTQHVWLEGSENHYLLVRDAQGNVVHGHAFGYVGSLCGNESQEFDVGAITAGTRPTPSSCETCSICTSSGAGGDGGAGRPEACP